MTEYRFIYKCRLCGGTNESTCVSKEGTAQGLLTLACLGNPPLSAQIANEWHEAYSNPYQEKIELLTTHICQDGQMGVADLQGYKKVTTEEEI